MASDLAETIAAYRGMTAQYYSHDFISISHADLTRLLDAAETGATLRAAHGRAAERVIMLETVILEAMKRIEADDVDDGYNMLDMALATDRPWGKRDEA